MADVAAVKRKLMGSLHKAAVDDAVGKYGYRRETIEELLVLCGTPEGVAKRWHEFNRTPEQKMADALNSKFDLETFVAYVRDRIQEEKQQARHERKRQRPNRKRKRGRR